VLCTSRAISVICTAMSSGTSFPFAASAAAQQPLQGTADRNDHDDQQDRGTVGGEKFGHAHFQTFAPTLAAT